MVTRNKYIEAISTSFGNQAHGRKLEKRDTSLVEAEPGDLGDQHWNDEN